MGDFRVKAPWTLLQHVFLNLIQNGLSATASSARPLVVLAIESFAGEKRIRVTDNGIGVPPMDEDRIFEKFYTSSKIGEGFGVGLSFCREVVELSGGRIDLVQPSEGGAEFRVSF